MTPQLIHDILENNIKCYGFLKPQQDFALKNQTAVDLSINGIPFNNLVNQELNN